MKKLSSISFLFTLLLAAFFLGFTTACDKDDDDVVVDPPKTSDPAAPALKVAFVHTVDGQPLIFDVQQYANSFNQPYQVVELKYYISNVKLTNTQTGKSFVEPKSYHLIDATNGKNSFSINNLPEETFDKIEFSLGVDQAANGSTDKTGDLDPQHEMAWDWNSGYKFLLMEGKSNTKSLVYHVGGNKNYRSFSFPFQNSEIFQKDKVYTASFGVNLNELFRSPNQISFDSLSMVMNEALGEPLAENYANGMFTLKGVTK